MELTLVTYGGGTILKNVFNSIAILLNANGGLLQPLMIIALSCGGIWALSKAFFSGSPEVIVLRFFLPVIAITSLILLPTTSVKIEDVLTDSDPHKVDNVPLVLAFTAQVISTVGYQITDAIESVMHVPDDTNYNSTGMVFGSETALDISKFRISNAVLEQNLKRFSKQCVFYDLALNRYTLNDLKKTRDLWDFLERKTSNVRMIPYTDPTDSKKGSTYLTCQQALKTMKPIFESEKGFQSKQEIAKHLPLTFQALTGIKRSQEELIGQQLTMNILSNELTGGQYAKSRAQAQQKSTYHTLGALASSSLVTMRAVLESIIYASIIFIIPFSVLPGGISFITNWIWLTLWIQLWPPFYAILNYVMHSKARGVTAAIFQGLATDEQGLSFFTSIGLSNLNEDIFALSGYLAASIPFISWAIIKGGVSSFIHLAGSLMTPAHAAATATAGEQATGNISLGNLNYGQLSYGNTTGFQKNMAPSLSEGYFTESSGNLKTTYAGNEAIIDQATSKFRMAISSDDAIVNNFQKAQQSAEMITESHQKNYMESISSSGRNMSDLTTHLSESQNYSDMRSSREAYDVQESTRYLQSQANSLSEQYGISSRDGMSLLMSARQLTTGLRSIPVLGSLVEGICTAIPEYQRGTFKDELANSALNIVNSEDFQTNYQKVSDFAKSSSHSNLHDEGLRLVDAYSRSLDEVASTQEQFQFAKSRSDQISDTASWAEQHTQAIRKSLDQDLFNWASNRYGFGEAKRILTNGDDAEASELLQEFVGTLKQSSEVYSLHNEFQQQSERFDSAFPMPNKHEELEEMYKVADEKMSPFRSSKVDFQKINKDFDEQMRNSSDAFEDKSNSLRHSNEDKEAQMKSHLQSMDDDQAVSRLYGGIVNNITGNQKSHFAPLGWKE
jgi:conjugal transfer mating pair stabilization protein TraG